MKICSETNKLPILSNDVDTVAVRSVCEAVICFDCIQQIAQPRSVESV